VRPTEDIYLHLDGDGTYSLKPDLIPEETGSLNKSRCAGVSPGSARQNRGVLAPYYDYIHPQLNATPSARPSLANYAGTSCHYLRYANIISIFVSPL